MQLLAQNDDVTALQLFSTVVDQIDLLASFIAFKDNPRRRDHELAECVTVKANEHRKADKNDAERVYWTG